MCAPQYFWTLVSLYIWSVQTNEYRVKKISMSCTFCSFWNVALWNRHQERRCMPGLQRPQPSFLSKYPDLWMLQSPQINIMKIRFDWSQVYSETFGEREQGTVSLGQWNTFNPIQISDILSTLKCLSTYLISFDTSFNKPEIKL